MEQAATSPAPALTRGLAILGHLSQEGARSLEHISAELDIPKSSALRLLETLEQAQAVFRDPVSKHYHARQRLVALAQDEERLHAAASDVLPELAARIRAVVELYAWNGHDCYMIDRCADGEASAQPVARLGFHRGRDECDALMQVVTAFAPLPLPEERPWCWRNRQVHRMTRAQAQRAINAARTSGVGRDLEPNSNGIRRLALPIIASGRLQGALAVALAGEDNDQGFANDPTAIRATADAIAHRLADGLQVRFRSTMQGTTA